MVSSKWQHPNKIREDLISTPLRFSQLGRALLKISQKPELYYLVPKQNWVTDWIGFYITKGIQDQHRWKTHTSTWPYLLVGQFIHYGELGAFLNSIRSPWNQWNTVIATIFHGDRRDEFPELKKSIELFLENVDCLKRVVTASRIMEERLIRWGIHGEKVIRIPLGIDLDQFTPASIKQKKEIRRKFGIPNGAICIGSFQKDGTGWEEGLIPKLIKGPDIFLQVITRLKQNYPLFILLSGPARGYLKQGLKAIGVPFRHEILHDYRSISELYQCLDVYLITSREEGGPFALLESLASGIPLVSTSVGMAPDVIQNSYNGFLVESENVEGLAENLAHLIEVPDLRSRIALEGRKSLFPYDWKIISSRYYQELYMPLLMLDH